VRELLDELAGEMGRALEQEEIHIAYRDRTWTLTAELQIRPHADMIGGPQ
jgi:hypothetical protein